jgi:hypothetical protein
VFSIRARRYFSILLNVSPRPANKRVFIPHPRYFNLLILNFRLADRGAKTQMAKISHRTFKMLPCR